jgi:hypothetical protein
LSTSSDNAATAVAALSEDDQPVQSQLKHLIMKKFIFFLTVLSASIFALTQCKKNADDTTPQESVLPFIGALLRTNSEPVDGSVLLWYEEYIDDDREGNTGSYSANFYTSSREKTSAGTMSVGGEQTIIVPFLSGPNQYQKYISTTQTYGTTVGISLSGSQTFPAFSTSVYVPKKMKANSSMVAFELSKSNNLTIEWEPDLTTLGSKVYIVIAADNPGSIPNSPATIIETEDDGQYVINSSTFQSFQVGGTATIHIGRGRSFVTEQGGKEIEVTSVVDARSGPVDIIQ